MAAPRVMRPFLGPAKRIKISPPRTHPCSPTFLRAASDKADRNDAPEREPRENDVPYDGDIFADIESGTMTVEERLEHMGVDPAEYKKLANSQRKAEERFKRWEPKTKEEAQARWKQLQDTPDHLALLELFKKEGIEPIKIAKERGITLPGDDKPPLDPETQKALDALRTPINVQAVHLRPFRRTPEYGVPVCDLQLRTYSIRNLLLFADFAVRAAYYMGLCARGPIPLPRITERWTVPRSNFIFKKSQENFERVTMRRLIQIQDGHPDVVKAWKEEGGAYVAGGGEGVGVAGV